MKKNQTVITVREACYTDIDILCSMLSELFSIEDDFASDPEKQKAALEILTDRKTGGVIFVAEYFFLLTN